MVKSPTTSGSQVLVGVRFAGGEKNAMDRWAFYPLLLLSVMIDPALTTAQRGVGRIHGQPSYAVGDVDLAASRIYAHVFKKTSLGHEHAIEGRIRSGTISSGGQAGELVFEMRSFQADTASARKYIGLKRVLDASTQEKRRPR